MRALTVVAVLSVLVVLGFGGCGPKTESGEGEAAGPDNAAAPASAAADAAGGAGAAVAAPAQSPEEVAKALMEAGNSANQEAFLALMTEKARTAMLADPNGGLDLENTSFSEYTIGSAVVTDDTADVPIDVVEEGQAQKLTLKMRQETGAWRVFGIAMEMAEGMAMTIDFENIDKMFEDMAESMGEALTEGMEEAFSGFGDSSGQTIEQKKAAFDGLATVSEADYESMWKNTTDFRGKTTQEALTALAEGLKLSLEPNGHEDALVKVVDTDVTGISRLEAIERLCAAVELYPIYPDPSTELGLMGAMAEAMVEGVTALVEQVLPEGAVPAEAAAQAEAAVDETGAPPSAPIVLEAGPRPYPVAFNGPFLFELADLSTNAPNPTGSLTMLVRAYGLDSNVLGLLAGSSSATTVDRVEGPDGTTLLKDGSYYNNSPETSGSIYLSGFSAELMPLLRSVTHVNTSGSQGLALPVGVEEVTFDSLAEGTKKQAGDLTIAISSQSEGYTQFTITGPEEQVAAVGVKFWVTDADGNDKEVYSESTEKWNPGEANSTVQTDGAHAAVRLKLVSVSDAFSYPFEFKEVPVPGAEEMPEALAELTFEGHEAPLTIEFVRMIMDDPDWPEVMLNVVNHSNKDAMAAYVNMEYLNEAGEVLDDFPNSMTGTYTETGLQPIAAAGQSAEFQTSAFSAPEGTKSVRGALQTVTFADGTGWALPEQVEEVVGEEAE